jgi:hypothetical protein
MEKHPKILISCECAGKRLSHLPHFLFQWRGAVRRAYSPMPPPPLPPGVAPRPRLVGHWEPRLVPLAREQEPGGLDENQKLKKSGTEKVQVWEGGGALAVKEAGWAGDGAAEEEQDAWKTGATVAGAAREGGADCTR